MLNNRTPPRSDGLDHETAVWERLRAEIEAGRRSSDVYPAAAQLGRASDSAYLEYDDEELSAAMQAEEQDPGRSPREHEFSDLEERISEDSVPLDDAALLLDVHDEVQVIPPVGRRSQPPTPQEYATHAVDDADEAQTGQRISYFEHAQAEAYQQTPIAAFAQEHAASLARAQSQSRYEQAWADWDRQFDLPTPLISSPVEPMGAKRSRLLIPGLALVALLGLGGAAYQLRVVPGSQEEEATQQAAPPQPSKVDEAARAEQAQRAADEASARADEAARAAPVDTTKVEAGDEQGGGEAKAKVANIEEESSEARRERIREEKRAARREARHRRREERRLAAKESGRSEGVSSSRASDDAAEVAEDEPRPSKKKKRAASGGEDSEDPLYGLE